MKPELPSLSLYERSVFIRLHAFTKLKEEKKKENMVGEREVWWL
jgi:hypothetical protein